jgi:hypothetical protein
MPAMAAEPHNNSPRHSSFVDTWTFTTESGGKKDAHPPGWATHSHNRHQVVVQVYLTEAAIYSEYRWPDHMGPTGGNEFHAPADRISTQVYLFFFL